MSETVFRRIGPYEIQRQIGRGMAMVFLAKDTRAGGGVVALKVVADGPDADARDTAAAELRGAELQHSFLQRSAFVPEVYEIDRTPGYLYIAMEYVDGEDLSSLIRRGPLAPARALAIASQLCQFLEEVETLDANTDHASPWTLLHNDLKPNNVRIGAGDAVKVLDFGAAKPLSMSRRVTKNDFYSTPYLSPECLDSGERDRQTDTWALGVILYEMVAGRTPFRADDTRRLEERIRSRRPPEPLAACPRPLHAVIGKLLAPRPQDRYPNAHTIREDLERVAARRETQAEQDGWPDRIADEPPTRAVRRDASAPVRESHDDEPATRRTPRTATTPTGHSDVLTSASTRSAASEATPAMSSSSVPRSGAQSKHPTVQSGRSALHWVGTVMVVMAIAIGLNEWWIATTARRVSAAVPMQEFKGLTTVWSEYDGLSRRSWLGGLGVKRLEQALVRQSLILAERVAENYRTPAPTVRETQWLAAATALEHALTVAPTDRVLRGTLRYCEGQLHRIDGEARMSRHQTPQAKDAFAEAVSAFRQAAELRPNWPDPFLGLARTFIHGLEDIDAGSDAISRAQRLGYAIGSRETTQLAEGYRMRAETLERAATALNDLPQEKELLTRSRDAYRRALDLYATIVTSPDVPTQIRLTQLRFDRVEGKLRALDLETAGPGAAVTPVAPAAPGRSQGPVLPALNEQPWA